jgi:MFS family permease
MLVSETKTTALPLTQKTTNRLLPWIVCLSATLFFFYEFLLMNMFNAIAPNLEQTFHVTATRLGLLSAGYFWADVVFLFPAGLLLDRFSTRRIILLAMGLCVVSTFGFAASHTFANALLFRTLSGVGNAFALLACVRLAARWFPPERLALITGVIVTMAMLGGMVAQTPLTLMVHALGWREALSVNGIIGVAFLVIIFFMVSDQPTSFKETTRQHREALAELGFWKSIRLAIKNKQNWLGGIYTNLMNLPFVLFGAIYGASYLEHVHHLTSQKASMVITLLFLGTIIGAPIMGWYSDRHARRVKPMAIGAMISLLLIVILLYTPGLSFISLLLLFFLLGFVTSTQVLSYPLVAESNPSMLTGTGVGLASLIIMSGYALFQPLCGYFMDLHWSGLIQNDIPIYALNDYRLAFVMIPVGFTISLIATYFLRETHCKAVSLEEIERDSH